MVVVAAVAEADEGEVEEECGDGWMEGRCMVATSTRTSQLGGSSETGDVGAHQMRDDCPVNLGRMARLLAGLACWVMLLIACTRTFFSFSNHFSFPTFLT